MSNKNDVISKIYYDKSGYGSIKTTIDDARKKDKTITKDIIKDLIFTKNYEKLKDDERKLQMTKN